MTFKSKDEYIDLILISSNHQDYSFILQSINRFLSDFLSTSIHEFIQNQSSIITLISITTILIIILSIMFGRLESYLRLIDRFEGIYEVLKSYYFNFRGIDFNKIAASFRGEEVCFDDQLNLNLELNSVNRTIKRTINEFKPPTNLIISSELHYPGLINSSTNTCFLNSVLQSLASMPHLIKYLDLIHSYQQNHLKENQTPVINSLREILKMLNTPKEFKRILKPILVAQALFKHAIEFGHQNSLFNSEQQDAQEFLVIMIDAIESEVSDLINLIRLESIMLTSKRKNDEVFEEIESICRSPFRALMVNRIGCDTCGFTSVFRHSVTDHFSLNVPPKLNCSLEECLIDFTKLEILEDYICRKCSLIKTKEKLLNEINLILKLKEKLNHSKKKKLKEIKKKINLIEKIILKNDYENEEIEKNQNIQIQRISSSKTTKQTLFSRPPNSLTFHISRSTAYTRGVSFKNHCQVKYPEYLNLSSFCSTWDLNRLAHLPISSSNTKEDEKFWYKLLSVVVHYGSHSFGHYITFRRVRKDQWIRVSDETVLESELTEVLNANPFLIMYEKVDNKEIEIESQSEKEEEVNLLKCRKLHWYEI